MQLYNCFDAHIHCSISRLIKQRNRTEAIVLRQITNARTITTQHIRLAEQQLPGNQSAALSSRINRQAAQRMHGQTRPVWTPLIELWSNMSIQVHWTSVHWTSTTMTDNGLHAQCEPLCACVL